MTEKPAQNSGEADYPEEIDTSKPNVARVYDALLGGKDNFAVDRAVAAELIAATAEFADARVGPRLIRAALVRAVRHLTTEVGIDQFLDLGSGLPSQQNVHQVAGEHCPGARVVYVDNDPIVLTHGRALLACDSSTAIVTADVREPEAIFDAPEARRLLDFDRPIGLIMSAILHHLPEEQSPADVMAAYRERMPPGSHLFVTHLCKRGDPGEEAVEEIFRRDFGSHFRTREEILALLDGWDLLDPGLVYLPELLPGGPVPELRVIDRASLGAVARLAAS